MKGDGDGDADGDGDGDVDDTRNGNEKKKNSPGFFANHRSHLMQAIEGLHLYPNYFTKIDDIVINVIVGK